MSGPLRHIALTVEQTDNNNYAWLLIESAGAAPVRGIELAELHHAL